MAISVFNQSTGSNLTYTLRDTPRHLQYAPPTGYRAWNFIDGLAVGVGAANGVGVVVPSTVTAIGSADGVGFANAASPFTGTFMIVGIGSVM
jgi:hypothetical protein